MIIGYQVLLDFIPIRSNPISANTPGPEQNGRNSAYNISNIFSWLNALHFDSNFNEISSLGPIANSPVLVYVIARCRTDDKSLPEFSMFNNVFGTSYGVTNELIQQADLTK